MMISSKIILASKSPRRADLLRKHGVLFDVYVSQAEELTEFHEPAELPVRNAELKCAAVADIFPEKIVIGADTVILFDNTILGKPANKADAFSMLRRLSGKKHEVITGCAVICRACNFHRTFSVVSEVVFKELSDEAISKYISEVDVLDKAGAYAIQEHGEDIIQSFSGSLENIIGLPTEQLIEILKLVKA